MVQSISKNESLSSNFVNLTPARTLTSEEDSNIRAQFESIIDSLSSGAEIEANQEDEKNSESLSEILEKASSKYSMCSNCGAIFMGEVAICTNCGSAISQDSSTGTAASSV